MKVETLIKEIEHVSINGRNDRDVMGVTCDSRRVKNGYVFVAVPGHKTDGKFFVNDAIDRGAVAIVSENDERLKNDICHIRVSNARRALARMACVFNGMPSNKLQMIGITGTNGKTTVSYMTRDILDADGRVPGLIGTVECRIGTRVIPSSQTTPDASDLQLLLVQMVNAGCRSAVMEVSSHALDQGRVEGVEFDVAVFTNLTRDHLDYHKTAESYFAAKSLLFRNLGTGGKKSVAVINMDDPQGGRLAELSAGHAEVFKYGLNTGADVRAENVELSPAGSNFYLHSPWGDARIKMEILGRFNVSNALAAIAICGSLGVKLDLIVESLSKFTVVPGRLEEIKARKGFQVFVDYAHTDDALQRVLETLREITVNRLIVIFGCGGNRDSTKRPIMGRVAGKMADYVVVTSDNPRKENPAAIIDQICSGFDQSAHFEVMEDRAQAIRRGLAMAEKGDIVLIAGKGHEMSQELANTIIPFDDRQVARSILKEMQCL